ncbi:TonB-dependent receptor [Brevundimonas sp. SL130]|uniref:TonB-dependent receptor n=1 Tax=Brevundimonas sp. SL130 TaxID=2995143 RepID=UPI00226CB78C|nr:TonB-dependent receptor [Brevundimonas sp. SL130]WAC58728.1 TonB-dependent receptor [Brevundimonas sp. SL130]
MSRQNHVRRVALLCGASLVAVAAMAPTISMAQEAAQSDDAATVDEVVVTGIRAQLRSAQAIKKNSEVIVDSVTAVDIGALPDRSVSEALQRIPGVTLQRTNSARDPARLAAEGGGVFVRGLSGVRSETNGRDIFSASSGRGLSFEDVSADLMAGVDVYKNVAANMIEGGIAGTINLRTRVPFDNSEPLLAINADYNYGDLSEKGYWSGSIIGSDRWDTKIGEFGLLANVSISNVGNRTDSISTDRYDPVVLTEDSTDGTGQAGQTVYIPKYMGWRTIDWEQKRTAVALAAQWRPNDRWLFTMQALGSQSESYNVEYAMGTDSILTPNSSYSYNDQGVFVSGDIPDAYYSTNTRVGDDTKKTGDVSLNFKYTPNSAWSFSGDLQYVKSTAEIYSMTAYTQLEDRPDMRIVIDGDLPTITTTGGSTEDKSSYWWAAAMDHIEDNEADEVAGRLDGRYDFENNDFFQSVEFGVRMTDKNYTNRQTGYNWNLLSNQYWLNNTNAVYLDDSGSLGDSRLQESSFLYTFENFFRGDTSVPGVAWFPTAALLNQGTAHAYDILKGTETAGWGWTPLSDDYDSYTLGSGSGGVTNLEEKTEAAYVYTRFGNDTAFFGRGFDGNLGLRVVKTKTETNQIITLPSISGSCPTGADCTDFNQAVQFVSGGALDAGADVSKEYTNVLPSLNLRAFLTDSLQARVAVSRAIVRPEMYQLQPFTNLSINFQSDGYTLNETTPFTGTGGNPNLEPLKATNYDFSLEWYFAPTGSLTFAAFHKDLKDYIFSGSSTETYTNGGVTYDFLITRYTNGDEGKIDGFELAYSQFYDFLPGPLSGLGIQANFTYVDSSGGRNTSQDILSSDQNSASAAELPLEGLSKTSYNAAVLYEKYGISARLAYNWREEYLMTTSAANVNAPVWASDYGQLDGSIFYNLTEDVKIGIQSTNILNERTVLKVGNAERKATYNWVDTDRRIAVVLRAAF